MKIKNTLALALALLLCFSLTACGRNPPPADDTHPTQDADSTEQQPELPSIPNNGVELAIITGISGTDDNSFIRGAWEGLMQYATEKSIPCQYYQSVEKSDNAYLASINLAVENGATLIVIPGAVFENPIYIAQEHYPEVVFIVVDGARKNANDYDGTVAPNTIEVFFAEEQAGFLAGYAAVKDGCTKLGFMGGMADPAVVRFGYGFVHGAEYAATEMGLDKASLAMNYHYTGDSDTIPEIREMAASWYNDGVEVIFGCDSVVSDPVMAAAEASNAKAIGIDIGQSGESGTVITSALKDIKASVYSAVSDYYAGSLPAGSVKVFDAVTAGIGLSMDTSKFEIFTLDDYESIFAKLAGGEISLQKGTDVNAVTGIQTSFVVITLI